MWLISLAVLGVAVYLMYRNSARGSSARWLSGDTDPLKIAKARYASGEISKEEYETIRRELEEEARTPVSNLP